MTSFFHTRSAQQYCQAFDVASVPFGNYTVRLCKIIRPEYRTNTINAVWNLVHQYGVPPDEVLWLARNQGQVQRIQHSVGTVAFRELGR